MLSKQSNVLFFNKLPATAAVLCALFPTVPVWADDSETDKYAACVWVAAEEYAGCVAGIDASSSGGGSGGVTDIDLGDVEIVVVPEPPLTWPPETVMSSVKFKASTTKTREEQRDIGSIINATGRDGSGPSLLTSLVSGPEISEDGSISAQAQKDFLEKEAQLREVILLIDQLVEEDALDFAAMFIELGKQLPTVSTSHYTPERFSRPEIFDKVFFALDILHDAAILYPLDYQIHASFLAFFDLISDALLAITVDDLSHSSRLQISMEAAVAHFQVETSRHQTPAAVRSMSFRMAGGWGRSSSYQSKRLFAKFSDEAEEFNARLSRRALEAAQEASLSPLTDEPNVEAGELERGANGPILDIYAAALEKIVLENAAEAEGFSGSPSIDGGVLRLASSIPDSQKKEKVFSAEQLRQIASAFVETSSQVRKDAEEGGGTGSVAETIQAAASVPLVIEINTWNAAKERESGYVLTRFDEDGLATFTFVENIADAAAQVDASGAPQGPLNFARLTFDQGDIPGVFIFDSEESASSVATTWAQWLGGSDEAGLQRLKTLALLDNRASSRTQSALLDRSKSRFVPLLPLETYLVASNIPQGFSILNDGTILGVEGRVGSRFVVPPVDLAQAETLFEGMGKLKFYPKAAQLRVESNGQVTLAAVPSLAGVGLSSDASGTGWSMPETGDESDLGFVLQVAYETGLVENWQPAVAENDFFDSIEAMPGLSARFDRATGVVNVSGMRFRPAFTVSALSDPEETYREKLADSFGITYRLYDANADGLQDVMIYSSVGKQLLYGVND